MDAQTRYDEALASLKQFDDTKGNSYLEFGKYFHLTFAQVARNHHDYCVWARQLQNEATGRMLEFRTFLCARFTIETQIELARRTLNEEKRNRVQQSKEERARVLKMRMSTSRADQLVEFVSDVNAFQGLLVPHLTLHQMLLLPQLCRVMRASTSAMSGSNFLRQDGRQLLILRPENVFELQMQSSHDHAVCHFSEFRSRGCWLSIAETLPANRAWQVISGTGSRTRKRGRLWLRAEKGRTLHC